MFDIKSVPKIVIREEEKGSASIKKRDTELFLYVNNEQFMSLDTKNSKAIRQFYSSFDLAYGDVLVTGLGFGILTLWLATKPEVKSIKVLEISQDVVDLFLAHNQLPDNATIEIADAREYQTDQHFDCILLDHYELHKFTPEQLATISNNIPNHNLIWFWDLENYVRDIKLENRWSEFKKTYVAKFPNIDEAKITEYIDTVFMRKVYFPQ